MTIEEKRLKMKDYQKKKIKKIIEHYDYEDQREILVEECAELIQSAQKLKRTGSFQKPLNERFTKFVEELADVIIICEQMKEYIGQGVVEMAIDMKLDRQIKRIEEEKAASGKAVWEEDV